MPTTIRIDITVFVEDDGYGSITGDIRLPVLPQSGDTIAFSKGYGVNEVTAAASTLHVTSRLFAVDEEEVLVGLSDIVVKTPDDAKQVMRFFAEAYGLFGDPFSEEDTSD